MGAPTTPPTRAYAPHKPTFQRFHEYAAPLASSSGAGTAAATKLSNSNHPYARQYSHAYSARLAALRERCIANARKGLKDVLKGELKEGLSKEEIEGEVGVADKIIEVKEGVWSILVGTIVEEMDPKRRPVVQSKYEDAGDAQGFLFPNNNEGKGKKSDGHNQESLRSYLFDAEKGDVLHLEDESGRVELAPEEVLAGADDADVPPNALDPNQVATGVVAAVVGKVCASKGIMRVRSIYFAGVPPSENGGPTSDNQSLRGPTINNNDEETKTEAEPMLLLVSGLGCGSDSPSDAESGASLALRREMLLDYLTDPAQSIGASVCRVIVAGGGVAAPDSSREEDKSITNKKETKTYKSKGAKTSAAVADAAFALRELDLYLSELLSSGIPVDYVPGVHDATNANWPQRPMHSCLLPLSCGYVDLFGRGTNPYEGVLGGNGSGNGGEEGGMRVLGSDGLNIADLRRFLAIKAPKEENDKEETDVDDNEAPAASCMDALNQTLAYGHMAPTGPSSLPTFPSSESDPFVLEHRPSVYFCGNCEEFDTRLVDSNGQEIEEANGGENEKEGATRLVCVPSFGLTGEVVLVKLRSLECEVLSFNDATL